jgi:zinc and cadmium transporter
LNSTTAILALIAPILVSGLLALKISLRQSHLRLLLALSAAYLFSVSIIHLLPEAFEQKEQIKLTGLFIVIGFCLQVVIDTFSTGIEHGHVHLHTGECHDHLPYGIIIGLMLHSFLEGLPLYNRAQEGSAINYQLIYGLGMHNIPIAIAFVALLKDHGTKTGAIFMMLIVFSFMSPLGYFFSYFLQSVGLKDYQQYSQAAFALVIGIFLHISTAILFESSDHHKYNIAKVITMLTGIILAYLIS